ncbi:hypothetical protein GCM10010517_34880 [Streptosporangium fragile]|uniref:TerD domain-containing protein n=1 Tax=Streptosporangium fragile TaxID=46186 RepID=A0ABN3VYM9_9ACTN
MGNRRRTRPRTDREPPAAARAATAATTGEATAGADGQAAEEQPSAVRRVLRSPLTWTGGVLAAVAAPVLVPLVQGGGLDLVDQLFGRPPLRVVLIGASPPEGGPTAFRTDPTAPADRSVLLTDPSEEEFTALAHRHDAGAVGQLDVLLLLEGGRGDVRVVDIRPRIRRSTPILTGAYFAPDSGGQSDVIPLRADLDRPDTSLKTIEKDGKSGKRYFSVKQIDLKRGERETLAITFTASRSTVEFDLEVTLFTGGELRKQVIGGADDGVFRITGAATDHRAYGSVYVEEGTSWHEARGKVLCKRFPRSRGC